MISIVPCMSITVIPCITDRVFLYMPDIRVSPCITDRRVGPQGELEVPATERIQHSHAQSTAEQVL